MKKTNKCIDCGKQITPYAKRCYLCEDKSRYKERNKCIDCGKIVTKESKRCQICRSEYYSGKNHPNWTGGPKYLKCIDCGKKLKSRDAKRCLFCQNKLYHKKINKCIDCGKKVSKKNIRRCKYCSNIARRKEPNKCIDCKIIISKSSERCNNCRAKHCSGKNHPNWTGGYSGCIDCGKKIKSRSAKRCITCYKKSRYVEKNRCIDCNKEICQSAKRCQLCRAKNSRIEKPKCIDCGKKLSRRDAKRCAICKIKEMFKTIRHKKNKPERFVEKLLNRTIPKEYKYVGNGKFWIEKYNPDFINMNGQKKIIEFFGDYWHTTIKGCKKRDEKKLKTYKKYGYDCLVVRTKDLKNKNLENRILDFNKKEMNVICH